MGQCISLMKLCHEMQGEQRNLSMVESQSADTECASIEYHPYFAAEFQATQSGKKMANKTLAKYPVGTFILRRSVSRQGEYTLVTRLHKGFAKFPSIATEQDGSLLWKDKRFDSLEDLVGHIAKHHKHPIYYPMRWMVDLKDCFDADAIDGDELYERLSIQNQAVKETIFVAIPSSKSTSHLAIIYLDDLGVFREEIEYDQETRNFSILRYDQRIQCNSLTELIDKAIPESIPLKVREKSPHKLG